jgi:putative transcriptional regulator
VKRAWIAAIAFFAAAAAAQQDDPPNGMLLVAREGLPDRNFGESVVLVSQTRDGQTVGVILNKPTGRKHPRTGEAIYLGGPVMGEVTVALFRSPQPPGAAAFHVLRGVYLTMHPANIEALVGRAGEPHRLFAGFSGWAPGQLENEIRRGDWLLVPPSEALLFRGNTDGMWRELWQSASGKRAEYSATRVAFRRALPGSSARE